MPALVTEKAAEFISTNLKEEGDQTEREAGLLLPRMSSRSASELKPNPQFAQFPSLLFFKQLYF